MRHRFVTTTAALLSLLVLWVVGAELGTLRPTDEVATPGEVADFAAPLIGLAAQQGSNYAERVASGVAIAGTNYTDAAIQAILPVAMTNWQASVNALTNGAALGATALQPSWAETGTVFRATEVTGAQSALIATAWQNPASAVDWTWTSNGREITLTGYSGPNAVVIPDMLDGLPVTGFGGIFRGNIYITSIGGGANIKAVGGYAFYGCKNLNSVSMPACTTVGNHAFHNCANLNSVSLPACTTVGDGAFYGCEILNSVSLPACTTVGISAFVVCANLNSVSLPACTTVSIYAFYGCGNLSSVTFGQNAPAQTANVFEDSTPTIYVSNPHATGWGDTWNGRPVVRAASMADIDSHNTNATAHADIRQMIQDIPLPPTNVINGWVVWDEVRNRYWTVRCQDLRFFIYDPEEEE